MPRLFRSSSGSRALGCAALLLACHTDTSGLERHEPAGSSSDGSVSSTPDGGAAASPGADQNVPEPSPMGLGSLAVLHGLVDGGHLFVCLRDLGTNEPLGSDGFASAQGLAFGEFERRVLDWDLASLDIELTLFAAPEAQPGQSCEGARQAAEEAALLRGLDAGTDAGGDPSSTPSALRAVGSLTLAAGSLFSGRHYLLVATGCAAPESLATPESCGPPDPLFGARSELVLVEFGAQLTGAGGDFGLQFLNASRALGPADLSLQLQSPNDLSVPFVSGVSFGVLRPRAVASVEEPLALELRGRGSSDVALSQSWEATLQASGPSDVAPGKNYVLASIGPTASGDAQSSSAPRLVLIPAE